jgi:hypothetical protein
MAIAEFYVRPGGSSLNAGSTNTDAHTFEFASGSWDSGTGVFTLASGDTTGVATGDYASIYADGATATGCVCRVSSVTSTTITLQIAKVVGALPSTGTNNRTVRIGGAWASMRNIVTLANWGRLGNAQGNEVFTRVNVQNGAIYDELTTFNCVVPGGNNDGRKAIVQGFSSSPGDLGKAHLRGNATGASYSILTAANFSSVVFADFIFSRNGDSGSVPIVNLSTNGNTALRCWFRDGRNGPGAGSYIRCFSGGHASSGFNNSCVCIQCVAASNTGAGFATGQGVCYECIAEGNGDGSFGGVAGNGCNLAIKCVAIRSGLMNTRADGAIAYIDCGAILSSGVNAITSAPAMVVIGCGSTGQSGDMVAPESGGGLAILDALNIDQRSFSGSPYTSSPSGSFPKSLDLRPASGGGAESQLSSVFDVPSDVYTAIQSGFAEATATSQEVTSGGGSSIPVIGPGGLVY